MPNIINPNCPSLPQQVEKNTQDILKLFASNLEELSGLEFNPTSLIYQQDKAIISGKFIVTRDEASTEINGVVTLPLKGENGVVVDASEDNSKIRIALDQSDRQLFNYVQELVNRTTESDEIVFTSDMENYVENFISDLAPLTSDIIFDAKSDDINVNKGYTNGLPNGYEINSDFSPYDFAIVTGRIFAVYFTLIIDLNQINADNVYMGTSCFYYVTGSDLLGIANCTINQNKNIFKSTIQYTNITNSQVSQNNDYCVMQIRGVKR